MVGRRGEGSCTGLSDGGGMPLFAGVSPTRLSDGGLLLLGDARAEAGFEHQ